MNKLFVMTGGKYGYAYDFYNYILKSRGFDIYQLDFDKPASRMRYMLRLFFKKYDLIVSWEISRAIIPILAKHIYGWKGKLKHAKLITMFTRDCGEAFLGHDLGLNDKHSWALLLSIFNSDAITWNYDCFEEFQKYFPRFPKERFHVVHGGVDLAIYKSDERKRENHTIVAISNWFKPRKRLETLIEAMEFLPASWKLYIGGKFLQKDYEELCRLRAKRFGARVEFLGFVEKPIWLQRASVFVMPSECETGVESINEAMACGCKVLRVEGGGASEFLPKEEILPKQFDSICLAEYIRNVADNEELREINLANAKKYAWSEVYKETEKVLEV